MTHRYTHPMPPEKPEITYEVLVNKGQTKITIDLDHNRDVTITVATGELVQAFPISWDDLETLHANLFNASQDVDYWNN